MSNKDSNLSLYNSKYLKYKNKYLSLKKMFGGMESDGGMKSDDEKKINIIVSIPYGVERVVSILKNEDLVPAMAKEFGVHWKQIQLSFEDNNVEKGLSAENCGIVNYSRLTVNISNIIIKTKTIFNEIVAPDIVKLNPHLTLENIMGRVFNYRDARDPGPLQHDQDEDDIIDIRFTGIKLIELPESFGYIHVRNNLFLDNNNLKTLPGSFGNITIGGSLYLSNARLSTLPRNFGNITVKKELDLGNNNLKTLPESFGNIHVDNLFLSDNQFETLPESFGNIHVDNLFLNNNKFTINPIKPNNVANIYI